MSETDLQKLLPEIEAAVVRGWPALEAMPIDGWLYRHTSGGSLRANTVAALGYSGGDVEASIDAVEALAKARSAPPQFLITSVSQPGDLDQRLAARGYVRGEDHVTMAKAIADTPLPDGVELARESDIHWLAAYLSGLSENRRAMAPSLLAGLPPSAIYLSARAADQVISSGLTIPDGRVASVQCMATLPMGRRQGGAQRVLAAIEHLAGAGGQSVLYLQTSADNGAARALYEQAGFTVIGTYHARSKRL